MRLLLMAFLFLLVAVQPASAHRLKLFATVEGGTVSGYGFFIGGGRPQGATIVMRGKDGAEVYRGKTDDNGAFSWQPAHPMDITILIDAGDGHMAKTDIAADRFAGDPIMPSPQPRNGEVPVSTATAQPAQLSGLTPAQLASLIDQSVDRAVARQTRPLLEAYDAADGRTRFNDIVGGIGMIIGLAGIAMWASARKRKPPTETR